MNSVAKFPALDSTEPWTPVEQHLMDTNELDEEHFASRLFAQLSVAPQMISGDQLVLIEDRIKHDVDRRSSLVIATKTGAELRQRITTDVEFAKAAALIRLGAQDAKKRYTQLADVLEQVEQRLFLLLSLRDDVEELESQAAAERGES